MDFTITLPDGTKKEVSFQEYLSHNLTESVGKIKETVMEEVKEANSVTKAEVESLLKSLQEEIPPVEAPSETKSIMEEAPTYKYVSDRIIEIQDGSQYDTQKRKWVSMGADAAKWTGAFREYIRSVAEKRQLSADAEKILEDVNAKYLNEDVSPQGGYLVPPAFSTSIIEVSTAWASFWPLARTWPMDTVELSFPKLAQDLRGAGDTDADQFAGVSFSWIESGTTKPESEPSFEQLILHPRELAGYTELQNSLLSSSPLNLLNYINSLFTGHYTWTVDKALLTGTGANQPLGVINDPSVPVVARTTANRVKYADLLNMDDELPDPFHANAHWFCDRKIINDLRGEVDSQNRPIIQVMDRGELGRGPYTTLLGYPVVFTTNKTPNLGTEGDIILGDPSYYYVGDRGTFTVDVSTHYKFASNRTSVRGSGMVDGKLAIGKAFVKLDDAVSS